MTKLYLVLIVLFLAPASADASPVMAGRVVDIMPNATALELKIRTGGALKSARIGSVIGLGDAVLTPAGMVATIDLDDETQIVVGPEAEFTIESLSPKLSLGKTLLTVSTGFLRMVVKKLYKAESSFTVKTGNSAMGVRGTTFVIEQDRNLETFVYTMEGQVSLARNENELNAVRSNVLIEAGYTSNVKQGSMAKKSARFTTASLLARIEKRAPGLSKIILGSESKTGGEGSSNVDFGIKKDELAEPKGN